MSRYVPVSTKMDSEDHYHSPYDTNDLDSDVSKCLICFVSLVFFQTNICHDFRLTMRLRAAWSGIPQAAFSSPRVNIFFFTNYHNWTSRSPLSPWSSWSWSGTEPSPGEKTLPLESRLRYNAYSPHHTIRQVINWATEHRITTPPIMALKASKQIVVAIFL